MNVRQIVWAGIGGLKGPHSNTVAQLKYNGAQYHLHIANRKAYALTSKRESVKTNKLNNKFANVAWLKNFRFPFKKETIIVVEVVCEHLSFVPPNERVGYVGGIMNKRPSADTGRKLALIAHDIVMFEGFNIESWDYELKYNKLAKYFPDAGMLGEHVCPKGIYCVGQMRCTTQKAFDNLFRLVVKKGFEGLILRGMGETGSLKRKVEKTADCFIIGFKNGKGKYEGQIGAIRVGVWSDSSMRDILDIGQCSGMDDVTRLRISKNRTKMLNKIVEVKYMDWTGSRLRHPRFVRFRTDKNPQRCTLSQITGA